MSSGNGLSVALVTQWFPPEPVTVPVWLARALARRGHDVRVLTGMPNYPDGRRHDGFPRFRPLSEIVESFPVRRAPLFASHSRSAVPRILNYVSWASAATLLGREAFDGADAALVYSSPATAALPAMWQRRRKRIPYVLMVQDVWPDSVFAAGFLESGCVHRLAERGLQRFVNATYAGAHRIAVIAPGMKDLLVSRGVPANRIEIVFNWVDEEVVKPLAPHSRLKVRLGLGDCDLLVMYAGNHGPAQNLSTLVRAMRRLPVDAHVHLVMVGNGIERAELMAEAADLEHVHFLPAVPVESMSDLMAGADVQVVSLRNEPLFHLTLPGKVQSIMAAGRPMLVAAPGDAAKIVRDANAGIAVAPGMEVAIADGLCALRDTGLEQREAMGTRGRAYYEERMSEEVGSSRLVAMLESAVASGG